MGYVILGLLMLQPQTLYDLSKQFQSGISLFYSASIGSLRPALQRLLEAGFVDVEEAVERGRNKRTYSITRAGREEHARWMREPITGRDLEVQVLSRVFFLGLIADDGERREVLTGMIERVEADLTELEATASQLDSMTIPAEVQDVFTYQRATLDYGILQHRTALDWLTGHRDSLPRD